MDDSFKEMDKIAQKVVKKARKIDISIYYSLRIMYVFGLRISEAVNIDKIIWAKTRHHIIITNKKNNVLRKLTRCRWLVTAIRVMKEMREIGQCANIAQVRKYISSQSELSGIRIGNKACVTHVFRHLYAKRRFGKRECITYVADRMSVSVDVARRYVTSKIK